ncbi:R-spondin-2 [Phasianus colchicus]|uniref:R-spondin-2 n=1 Tax=Phasianus colchicus TaxID=9054 RepID=UPI00129D747A|nr:R-spondin-2 [Phasianus colchicus]
MRQYGECLHSCPSGYYGLRTPDMNRCSRCRIENCDSCFSRDFCTKCKAGFYSHRGRCFRGCPPGFAALEELMECVEGCEVGQWSEWGTCSRNNKTCGFKWGLETRTRQIVKKPAKDTIPCPTIAESRRCKMAVRHCPGGFQTRQRITAVTLHSSFVLSRCQEEARSSKHGAAAAGRSPAGRDGGATAAAAAAAGLDPAGGAREGLARSHSAAPRPQSNTEPAGLEAPVVAVGWP